MGLKAVVTEVVSGRYYTRHPIELVRYVWARGVMSRSWSPEPTTVLANLGVDPGPYLEDYERWRPTFDQLNREGNDYLGFETGVTLYAGKAQYLLVRALRPEIIIETGIASGVSTTHLGAALIDNGTGSLYSIELPHEDSATRYAKYGAKYDSAKPPGWAIPPEIPNKLGDRLNLVFEDVRTALPRLLETLGPIDVFVHDDLHTPKHMTWEFDLVWPRLKPGGVLACDNAEAAWLRFARSVGAPNGGRDTVGGFGAAQTVFGPGMTRLSGLTRPVQRKIDSTVRRANLSIPDGASQVQLRMTYRQMLAEGRLPPLSEVGFKVFSQTDEDGILLFLFSVLGSGSKTCIEICAGNGIECNTANLLVNHGWSGLLVDGDDGNVEEGRGFYAGHPGTYVYPPQFLARWITRGNVNEVVAEAGFAADVDLLSLDLDGVDYWIWEALDVISPRVVVLEYQDILGPEAAVTVPYADDFNAWAYPVSGSSPNFSGASLGAFVKLGRRKGYRLVGTNRFGYNAFFLRDDVGTDEFPEISARDCFGHRKNAEGIRDRYPTVKALPWVEV